jgi:putative transposase
LAETLRYVELNPVRAGLVDTAWEWRWSSASARMAGADPGGFLQLETGREACTGEEWRRILQEGWDASALSRRIRETTQTGRPLGEAAFLDLVESRTGKRVRPQKPGPKTKLVPAGASEDLAIA